MKPLSLPDELVDQISGCALTIPDETFRAWRTPQTYAGTPLSQPQSILATSSQWYRVGKPYLYEAAILRTQRQVRGFCDAICKYQSDGKLARFLRRLRVDGGYSPELGKIIRKTGPQITELFLCLDVSLDDSIKGLLKALKQVNPPRLFLDASPNMIKEDAPLVRLNALYNAVSSSASGWTNLRRVDVGPGYTLPDELLEYLLELPQVEHASVSINPDPEEFFMGWIEPVLRDILERTTLKEFHIRNGRRWLSQGLSTWGAGLEAVRNKLFLGEGKDMVPLAAFPEQSVINPEPTYLPELPDKVWARILWIATHYDGYDPAMDDYATSLRAYDADRTSLETRLQVLYVCKRFHRIGEKHLYSHPWFCSDIRPFLARIQTRPDLAAMVQVLHLNPQTVDEFAGLQLHKPFSAPLVNLVRLHSSIHWQVFPDFLKHVPENNVSPLEVLEQCIAPPDMRTQRLAPTDMITPSMFLKLPHLRRIVLSGGRGGRLDEVQVDLPHLENLCLYEPGIGLTKLFRIMQLPRLREFGFKATSQAAVPVLDFLRVHGAKLDVLTIGVCGVEDYKQPILDHCPNVTELRLETGGSAPVIIPSLVRSSPHSKIERITLPNVSLARRDQTDAYEIRSRRMARFNPHEKWLLLAQFLQRHREKLPALAEIRILGQFDWPVNRWQYHECDAWVATSVALALHPLGIALADKAGNRWCRFDSDHACYDPGCRQWSSDGQT